MKHKRDRQNSSINQFKIDFRNGRFEIPGADTWHTYWREPYYLLLTNGHPQAPSSYGGVRVTIPWWWFLGFTVLAYLLVNILFAIGFLLDGNCIENADPGSFGDLFFFSVQTLTSIGYGAMYPTTTYADILVASEAFIGIIGIALITSLAFTRFSQLTAKVIFSRVAVICEHNGIPTLMFRAGNQRHNQILEAQVRVYLMQDEVSEEGEYMRRFHLLKPIRDRTPTFTLSWTIMHPIDEASPLYSATPASLAQTRAMIMLSFSGIDETVSQSLHAPYSYSADDVRWFHRFAEIIRPTANGGQHIDYTYFHQTISVES